MVYEFNKEEWKSARMPTTGKKSGKTDAQIIESAGRPQPSLDKVGENIYKELGDEVAPVLEKYKMMPKK